MRSGPAVHLSDVRKTYRLYASKADQAIDAFGLSRLFFWRRGRFTEHEALRGVSLEVAHGERVGLIGRNGAGKTTLLKLITGNFAPTSGSVIVDGSVQALMNVGLGFHPEFSGLENIRSSLTYNGLSDAELEAAVADVVEFVELDEYLRQPMKTYSLGMQARLMFATATAIRPDILIVDEVLGAGDAYFSAKSADRMHRLARSGCTLLLVSHSTPQVLQFCERVVWLDHGQVVMDDEPLRVVKAYEEFNQRLTTERKEAAGGGPGADPLDKTWLRERLLRQVLRREDVGDLVAGGDSGAVSAGGISRWGGGEPGLRIESVRVTDDSGTTLGLARTGEPLNYEITVRAEKDGSFPCTFCVLLFTQLGQWLTRDVSAPFQLEMKAGETVRVRLHQDASLLGNGAYVFSAAIYQHLDLRDPASARFYDLLARSFELRVLNDLADDESVFVQPGRWERLAESAAGPSVPPGSASGDGA